MDGICGRAGARVGLCGCGLIVILQRARESALAEQLAQLAANVDELRADGSAVSRALGTVSADSFGPILTQQLHTEVASLRARVSMLTFDFEVFRPLSAGLCRRDRAAFTVPFHADAER
jgi:hypothetical protein